MSNNQLPAHLLALFNSNPELGKVGENIRSEGSHAKVKFTGKKWVLLSATGEETAIKPFWLTDATGQPVNPPQAINGIDVIIVDVNENKTHVVYEKNYNENEETAPIWSSDDGTPVPVEHENKVVSDYRRIAVLWADNPELGLFELRIASKSLTPFAKYRTALGANGVPLGFVVTRITFDDAYAYPVLSFAPTRYLTDAEAKTLEKASTAHKDQVQALIGLGKRTPMLAAPVASAALPAPAVQSMGTTAPVKRGRKAKEETVAVNPPQGIVLPMGAPAAPSPAAAVVTKPTATTTELDTLLQNIMGR